MGKQKGMTIKISVCVTTYNRAELLDNTLRSLAKQTHPPDELIVSDDFSQDNTQQIVKKWQKRFKRFIYNRNSSNLYMPGNLNVAVGLSSGKYIANLHDGDEFDPFLLEKWEKMLDYYPTAGFVFNAVATRQSDHSPQILTLHDVDPFTPGREFFKKYMLHKYTSIVWGTVMARSAVYKKLLPFDNKFGFISDVDMWMRICLDHDVAYIKEPLVFLDNTPTQERSFSWDRLETIRKMQLANIKRFYGDNQKKLRKQLFIHTIKTQRLYIKRILGRIRHKDWKEFQKGLILFQKLGIPIKKFL
ncbi:hypothetical protein ES708_17751 [subsurface metagenome]